MGTSSHQETRYHSNDPLVPISPPLRAGAFIKLDDVNPYAYVAVIGMRDSGTDIAFICVDSDGRTTEIGSDYLRFSVTPTLNRPALVELRSAGDWT